MDNFWDLKLDSEILAPKQIIEEQAKYLADTTSHRVQIEVKSYKKPIYETTFPSAIVKALDSTRNLIPVSKVIEPGDELPNNNKKMSFQVNLQGKKISNFEFNMFTYWHSIEIYPVSIDLNPDIKINDCVKLTELNQDEFCTALKVIINSEKVKKIVNAIYHLSN